MELSISARQSLTSPSAHKGHEAQLSYDAAQAAASGSARLIGAVAFRDVGKTYQSSAGPVHALQEISLEIAPGSIFGIFGIIGRSGAGKSSLLRTINRLERPTQGQVLVDGVDIATLDDAQLVGLRRRIGMIFQHFNLLSSRTVFDNVALPLKVAGVSRAKIAERVRELLTLVGLQEKAGTYPSPAARKSCFAMKPLLRWTRKPRRQFCNCCATSTASSASR